MAKHEELPIPVFSSLEPVYGDGSQVEEAQLRFDNFKSKFVQVFGHAPHVFARSPGVCVYRCLVTEKLFRKIPKSKFREKERLCLVAPKLCDNKKSTLFLKSHYTTVENDSNLSLSLRIRVCMYVFIYVYVYRSNFNSLTLLYVYLCMYV